MAVIDELERQKNASQKHIRWRSAATLAVIEKVAGSDGAGRLREADFTALEHHGIPSGQQSIEVLFDLPGHVRLPINDDEIVDRAMAVQLLSGEDVTFLRYETNQTMRANHMGLADVIRLRHKARTSPVSRIEFQPARTAPGCWASLDACGWPRHTVAQDRFAVPTCRVEGGRPVRPT